jgi:hypothetical protein
MSISSVVSEETGGANAGLAEAECFNPKADC